MNNRHSTALASTDSSLAPRVRRGSTLTALFVLAAAALVPACVAPQTAMDPDEVEEDFGDEDGAGEDSDEEDVGTSQDALTVADLAYAEVKIQNRWGCPGGSRCDAHIDFTGTNVELYTSNVDAVTWRLIPVPGKTDEYYINSAWHCDQEESRCLMNLSFSGTKAKLYPKDDDFNRTPWKFVKVPGTDRQFHIYNKWGCEVNGARCDMHLSFTGKQIELYPKDNTADLVPWKITTIAPRSSKIADLFASDGSVKAPGTYSRGVGTIPTTCPSNKVKDGLLCYPKCDAGYDGVGPVCWEECPSGYTDIGALCQYTDGPATKGCDWEWTLDLTKVCSCPDHYSNMGTYCQATTVAKDSYGRGAGTPLVCTSDKVMDAGLCYPRCDPGYEGYGPVCTMGEIGPGFCAGLYDPALAEAAIDSGSAMTYGIGAGVALGAVYAAETGVVYGENGEYGCYTQTCTKGVALDASISAWGSFGNFNSFSEVSGSSITTYVGVSAGVVGASFGVVTTTDFATVQGYVDSLSLGVGVSPVAAGLQQCDASVEQLW